jgi:polyhydroxybutyrate depolymerase
MPTGCNERPAGATRLPAPRRVRAALIALVALAVSACSGATQMTLWHDGAPRAALIDRPERPSGPGPLLIVLHAAMLDGSAVRQELGLSKETAAGRVTLVFPDSSGLFWNDESLARTLPAMLAGRDDIGFLDSLISSLVAEGTADPAAIHLAGISNGGMMALRYACRHADRIASLTLVMATMAAEDAEQCRPARPLDVMLFAGTGDPVVRWTGEVSMLGMATLQQRMSVPASFGFWQRANGCAGQMASQALPRRGAGPDVVLHTATGCRDRARTVLYEVRGGGHRLPGDDWPLFWMLGRATSDIQLGTLLLDFVTARRPTPGSIGSAVRAAR